MKLQKGRRYLGAIAMGFAFLIAAACQPGDLAQLEGILQNVDSLSGDVTVKFKDGGTITFNLKDVNVEALRQAVGNAALEQGSQVTVEVDKDKRPKRLKAVDAHVDGVIESLDDAKKTVTITAENGEKITLEVTAETRIKLEDDDKTATFAALRVGQELEAKYNVETKKALKLEMEDEDEDENELTGTIRAVGNAAKTVTILARNGVEATLTMVAGTELEGVNTFADLKVNMRVEAKFNPATKELIELEVKAEKQGAKAESEEAKAELEGAITSLDANLKTVTVRAKNGIEGTFKVVTGTRLDDVGAFGDLKTGMMVHARFNDTTKELIRLKVQREDSKAEMEGAITAVNTQANTITIRAENGVETLFKATTQTEFKLKGTATFADMKTGMKVEARFNPTTMDLIKLDVKD